MDTLRDHAPDCGCHKCQPYSEWLDDAAKTMLIDHVLRPRVTWRDPFGGGSFTGVIVWFGSRARGWVGKPLNPIRWDETWRITSRPRGRDQIGV